MRRAGASARQEYERRRARDAARRRQNRWQRVTFTIATPFVVYAAVRLGLPWGVETMLQSVADAAKSDAPVTGMDPDQVHLIAVLFAFGSTVTVVQQLWGSRRSTEAWAKGAAGEERTGSMLDALPAGWEVRHDLRLPGSRANIDHVVVGPGGVFTIETKNYRDGVRISRGRVTSGGRVRDGIVEQARRQAEYIATRTQHRVTPLVVVHGGVDVGWFGSPMVDGVRFASPHRLTKVLRRAEAVLSAEAVTEVARRLDPIESTPTPIARPIAGCSCGGEWVERRRRKDGARFLGCSRFPECRATRSIP